MGTHEPNKPEFCYKGEPEVQHGFTPQLELDLLMPYVDYLKSQLKETVVFQAPLTDRQRLDRTREELRMIAESAKYSGDGTTL